jgi:hypothetical protein
MTTGLRPRQVANQLLRAFRAEADFLRVLGGWTPRVTENDERLAFARDLGQRAEHGELLLARLHRLRTTPQMIRTPDAAWRELVELVDAAPTTADLVGAVYDVIGRALITAYRQLLAECDPLADEATNRLISRLLLRDGDLPEGGGEGLLA